eukprot:Gregarina_sp_Poly_1__10876@NODE_847_length_5991_cov_96_588623_g612_i0_p3_GENE_NODE_847_length_5991_cov_96_588623_g612_i0NODE_847_length_5991_cov_96_588623_g612_i0_p3_ORF_typecomplete_len346_score48_24Peptidase_C14/PF00656_22/3_4e11CUE/PF02845_16/0_0002UBA/PF00627_31/0_0087HOIPUBA/PF16678_5/0_081DMA/PF03474_14/0_1UBA_4/PF14555_6/9_9e03UBA_4/PF14555_6/0_22PhnI/PF05861_12/0_21_NODE_847_length_5991_cov_96_588623_g612_i044305467
MDALLNGPWRKKLEAAVTLVHPGFNTGMQLQLVPSPPPVFVNPNAVNPLAPQMGGHTLHPPVAHPPVVHPPFAHYAASPLAPPTSYHQLPPTYFEPPPTYHAPLPSHTPLPNNPPKPAPITHEFSLTSSFFGGGNLIEADQTAQQENPESKITKLQRIFPEASAHDARKALEQTNGDLDAAMCLLIDWRTAEAAKTQEAHAVCASTAFAVFPLSTTNVATSSYPEWLRSGAVMTTQGVHSMAATLDSTFPPSGRQKALLIGINYDGTRDELNGPRQDLKRMGAMLEKVYGFRDTSQTRVELTDAPENFRNTIYLPTRKNILSVQTQFSFCHSCDSPIARPPQIHG